MGRIVEGPTASLDERFTSRVLNVLVPKTPEVLAPRRKMKVLECKDRSSVFRRVMLWA